MVEAILGSYIATADLEPTIGIILPFVYLHKALWKVDHFTLAKGGIECA